MKGIKFDNLHTFTDWGLILSKKTINTPSVKTETIEIVGGDGVLDMTEYFGDVKYKNRQISFEFSKGKLSQSYFLTLFSQVQNSLHGKKMKVIIDDDPNFYYMGRVEVSDWKSDKNIGKMVIEVDAEPYKYKLAETNVTKTVSGTTSITLANLKKRVIPTIETTAAMTIVFGNFTKAVNAGTFKFPEISLAQGNNVIEVTGNGTVTFTYQEGGL